MQKREEKKGLVGEIKGFVERSRGVGERKNQYLCALIMLWVPTGIMGTQRDREMHLCIHTPANMHHMHSAHF